MQIHHLPCDQNTNGWAAILPTGPVFPPLRGNIEADWVVVGAGYAGLAFARRIAELRPHDHVVVIDAVDIADSASARNSGFVINLPHNVGSSTVELAKASTYRTLLQYGVAHLKEVVDTHKIACDWSLAGKYHCAVSPQFDGLLATYQQELQHMDEPFQLLEEDALTQKLGTAFYRRAVYTPGCILLNPAALVRGLAASLPANVSLYSRTPALNIHTHGKVHIETPYGDIHARKLMLAINGAGRGLPLVNGRVFAMSTFATLTEPLTPEQRQRLGDLSPWGLTPVNALAGATLRYTHDHRFLIREHVNFVPGLTTHALENGRHARRHQALFTRLWPQLRDVNMAWTWSGLISITRNGAPIWGELAPGVYASIGCNGAGVSKQSAFGRLLAEFALGEDNPLIGDMHSIGQANYLLPRPFLDLGVQAYLARERWRARSET